MGSNLARGTRGGRCVELLTGVGRMRRLVRRLGVSLLLALTLLVGGNSPLAAGFGIAGFGIGRPAVAQAAAAQGKPHHFDPHTGTKSVIHLPPAPKLPPFTPLKQRPPMAHGFVPAMKPGSLTLDPTKDTQLVGSDGRLEIDVPAGAVTAGDVAAAGGTLALQVREIAPPSGSNAGSASVSLGSYLAQVVDGHGNPVARFAHGLRKAATLKLHYGSKASALDLDHAFIVFNGSHPAVIGSSGLGAYATQNTTYDRKAHVLQGAWPADPTLAAMPTPAAAAGKTATSAPAPAPLTTQWTPSTIFTFDTYAPVAKFGSPDPLNVDLSAGGVTEGIQLDVPPGPSGAMPDITLAYNSGAVSEQHSPQGAAGWVGEGWSLSLGSISWAEHNVLPLCSGSGCYNTWQSQWELTDPFGTSTELIPPNLATSTYYDDSANWYCAASTSGTPCPIQFHTASETYAKIYAYVGPIHLGSPSTQNLPCFRAYLTNGVMEEFGCTTDSLQYYPIQPNSVPQQGNSDTYYPVNWMLDLITNPNGDQVHITYQADTAIAPDGLSYPRDLVLATIEWDAKDCYGAAQAQTMCIPNGSASNHTLWQPLYRVQFNATHQQAQIARKTTTGTCNPDGNQRCDDPLNLASSGVGLAPLVNGTWALNDAAVQTNPSTYNGGTYNASTWNTVRDYQLSYEQSGPTTITDPATGKQISTAGYLDLTQLQEVGDDGTTAYPPTTFSYTSQTENYEDGSYTPYSTTFCGPSWNTGGNGGTCDLWSQTYDGNSRYLASVSNGQGLLTTFTWANARNNTHGVNAGGSSIDPIYCNSHQSGYPCNSADDQAWSRIVVTGQTNTVVQLTQSGQGGLRWSTLVTNTHAYTYQLAQLQAQECLDCVAGMYWGNQNDGDYLDYYNGHFMGFAETDVSNPDGSIAVHKYFATEGYGVYDTSLVTSCPSTLPPINTQCQQAPWWYVDMAHHVSNVEHGREYEADYYDTSGHTDSSHLLKQVTEQYSVVCGTNLGLNATPTYSLQKVDGTWVTFGPWDGQLVSELDHNNPMAVCDVRQTQWVTTMVDGTGHSVSDTEAYTYDGDGQHYGRMTQAQSTCSNSGTQSGCDDSPTQIVYKTTYVWNGGLTVPAPQNNNTNQENMWGGVYLIDFTASTDTENSSGTQYTCQRTNYDNQGYLTGPTSLLTQGNATEQDQYGTSCGANPTGALTTTISYDGYGNVLSTKDPDANGGDTTHQGASGTACAGVTTCAQYDPLTQAKTTLSSNDANQSTATGYNPPTDPAGGYGLWPTSTTDPNGGVTTYGYDARGRETSLRAPGQTSGLPTQGMAYTNWCSGTNAQIPCVEVDTAQRLDSGTAVTSRQFYDGFGRLVETRTPAPGGQDVVQYTLYNAAGEMSTQSVKYFVTAYTGAAGLAAYSIPDTSQVVTTTTYDGLSRTLSATDPLSNVTQMAYSVVCGPVTGDTSCYEQLLGTDANNHRHGTLADGLGRLIYDQRYSGNSPSTYAVYSTTKNTYDSNGNLTQVLQQDGHSTTSNTYNTASQLISTSDPDRGLASYSYDNNGNLTRQIDARCGTSLPQTACSCD
jgi:YD repeat-containing protein